ncbi:MAG: hypothetical protein U0746_07885 [Gemmataceae bacterium]
MASIVRSLALVVAATWAFAGPSDDATVADVLQRHKASVESIHTFACRFKVDSENPDGTVSKGQHCSYWRSNGRQRLKWSAGGKWQDTLIADGRSVTLTNGTTPGSAKNPGGQPCVNCSIKRETEVAFGVQDPWMNALLAFPSNPKNGPGLIPFGDLFMKLPAVRFGERLVAGTRLLVIESKAGEHTREFWFDPSANYLVRRVVNQSAQADSTHEVSSFLEVSPGQFFPTAVEFKATKAGDKTPYVRRIVFDSVVINRPVAEDIFRLAVPDKARVNDLIEGKKYVAGPDGRPAGPVEDLPTPPPAEGPSAVRPRTETKSEPAGWGAFVLPTSLVILATGCVAWVVVRLRGPTNRSG